MANIVKSNEQASSELDPFRMMRDLLRWDPFRTIAPIAPGIARTWMPTFEVRETGDTFLFKADLPGIEAEHVDVSLSGNRLQISGKREAEKETKDETVYVYERSYGDFTRSFTLPDDIDAEHIKSELKDGVLTIVVPKKAAAKPRKIVVGAAAPRS